MNEITIYLLVAAGLLLLGFGAIVITSRRSKSRSDGSSFFDAAADVLDAVI